jgi:hypothetical protein
MGGKARSEMKKEHWIIGLLALGALIYFGWPHVNAGVAWAKSVFNRQRSFVVDGTAHSGADATVLTNTCIGDYPGVS